MNISHIFDFFQSLLLIYFGFSTFYLLFFAIASYFYKYNVQTIDNHLRKFLILGGDGGVEPPSGEFFSNIYTSLVQFLEEV